MMGMFTVTVKAGDTLSAIALEMFGDASKSREIYLQNKTLLDANFERYTRSNRFLRLVDRKVRYGGRHIVRPEDCISPGMELRVHVPPATASHLPTDYPVWVDAKQLLRELEAYPPTSPVYYHELRDIIEKCTCKINVITVGPGGASPAPKPRS